MLKIVVFFFFFICPVNTKIDISLQNQADLIRLFVIEKKSDHLTKKKPEFK